MFTRFRSESDFSCPRVPAACGAERQFTSRSDRVRAEREPRDKHCRRGCHFSPSPRGPSGIRRSGGRRLAACAEQGATLGEIGEQASRAFEDLGGQGDAALGGGAAERFLQGVASEQAPQDHLR